MKESLYWSGGAEPARGMRISCVRAGAGWEILSSVRNAGKGSERPKNHQETCSCIVKRDKVKSYKVLENFILPTCTKKYWFGTRFRNNP